MSNSSEARTSYADLPTLQANVLLASILVVALCGIVYELIIGTVSSYLLGNSVYQFSLTIGFFMFAMGIGSYLSRFIGQNLIEAFVYVEMALAIVGGLCSIALFMLFPYAPWFYTTAQFAFILLIGALVGLEIPLLTRVLAERRGTRRSIADVMSLDYVGALIGSVAFPLLLLPSLGLITSSFAIGLINIAVAMLSVIWLRDHLRRPRAMMVAVLTILAALIALTVAASWLTAKAQQHLYFDRIVWSKQTPYQTLVVTQTWRKNDLRLFIDGHLQFSEYDEHRYHEALVHPAMASGPVAKNVLVLGGGDGLAVREILKYDQVERIDLVDIDPDMTKLGLEFAPLVRINKSSLASPKVTIHNADAFLFVRQTDVKYDRVIIDFPDPHNEAISKLYSIEFYALVSGVLAEDAVVVTQSSSPYIARRTFWSIRRTMEEVFSRTGSFHITVPAFGVWGFNIAYTGAAGEFGAVPDGLHYVSPEIFAAGTVFPADISRPDELVPNSIFQPSLYEVYLRDLDDGPLS